MRYRITKYDPAYRNAQGAYPRDEWTSCTDIGKAFAGQKLTAEAYLAVETAYLEAIRLVAEANDCTAFRVRQLEQLYSTWEVSRKMKRLGLVLTEQDMELYRSVDLQQTYDVQTACLLSGLILRELLWAALYDAEGRLSFTFGYDYYLYADCPQLPVDVIGRIERSGLFVENLGEQPH